jgi:hypothetical protein
MAVLEMSADDEPSALEPRFIIVAWDRLRPLGDQESRRPARTSTEKRTLLRRLLDATRRIASGFARLISTILRIRRAQQNGLDVEHVTRAQASRYRFPVGHPLPRILYVVHPADPRLYVPLADFHRRMFEHKLAEAVDLVTSLGAERLVCTHIRGRTLDLSTSASLGLPGLSGLAAGGNVGDQQQRSGALELTMQLSPTGSAKLPSGLVWYDHEPVWQSVAKARLTGGLVDFSVRIAYSESFGVDVGLKERMVGLGFDIGGHFERFEETVWEMTGHFAPSFPPSVGTSDATLNQES